MTEKTGRPKKQLNDEVLEAIIREKEMVTIEGLRNVYLNRTGEDSLNWNTLQRHLEDVDSYEIKPIGDNERSRTNIVRMKEE